MAIEDPPPAAACPPPRHPDRPDVFVSYARVDERFVSTRLVAALEAREKDVWIDTDDIPPAAEWRERIGRGIEAALAFVFVLSPDSLASEHCGRELRQAVTANKRIVPVVYREVDPANVPDELNRPNWIWLGDGERYDEQFERLIAALETDLGWVDSHARLSVRAGEWARADRDRGFLLRGNDLRAAEHWLAAEASHGEAATPEQRDYILSSRRAASRRQLVTLGAVAVALVISVSLGALAVVRAQQRQTAEQGRRVALSQRQLTASRQVAAEAGVLHASRPDLSMLLGVQALRIAPTTEARGSLLSEQAQRYAGTLPVGQNVLTMAFSPDGRTLATDGDGRHVNLWDVASHAMRASLSSLGSIDSLAFSPDGRYLAGAGSTSKLTLWDAHHAHRQVAVCERAGSSVYKMAFSPDARTIAAANAQGEVVLVAVPSCKVLKRFKLFAGPVAEVAFNPADPSMLAAVGGHQTVALLDVRTGARLASLPGNTNNIYSSALAFTSDGRSVATAGPDHTVTRWSTRTHRLLGTLRGSDNGVSAIAFSPDGRSVATTSGRAILWDVHTSRAVAGFPPLGGEVSDVAFSPDGNLIATKSDGAIQLWKARRPIFQDAFRVLRAIYSHDGKTLAVVNANSTVTLLDARTHERRLVLTTTRRSGPGRDVNDVAFSPDDRLLATVGRKSAKLWNVRTGALVGKVANDHVDFLMSVAFSPDGRILAIAGLPGPIVLLDSRTLRARARLGVPGDFAGYSALRFSDEGRHLVAVGTTVEVWDVGSRKHLATLSAPASRDARVASAAVSHDGHTIGAGLSDGSILLWDLRTRALLRRQLNNLGGHTGPINGLAFSPDDRALATAGQDETVKLWDLHTTHRLIATLTGHSDPVNGVSFARDGMLASASDDQTAISWDLDPRHVSSAICRTLRTTLGRSDWARYVPSPSYGRVCPVYLPTRERASTGARPSGVADLVRRLPAAAYQITALDFKRARRDLGVAPDLDPKDYRGRPTQTPADVFDDAALQVVGYLVGAESSKIAEAINHGRVTAGVEGLTLGGEVVLLATDQPIKQIAGGLRRQNFRSSGNGLYVKGSAKRGEPLSAVGLAPGLVVLSSTADEVSAALARTEPDAPTASKLKRLDAASGSLRVLRSYGDLAARRAPCLEAVVGGHGFGGSADTLTLYLTRRGRAGRVLLGSQTQRSSSLTRYYQPRDITVAGSKVSMQIITRPGALHVHNAATIARGTVQPEEIYRC